MPEWSDSFASSRYMDTGKLRGVSGTDKKPSDDPSSSLLEARTTKDLYAGQKKEAWIELYSADG